MKSIEDLAQRTGISVGELKETLNMKQELPETPCNASTVEEARSLFENAKENSPEERGAFRRWSELSLEQAEKSSTFDEAEYAYNQAPEDSDAETVAVQKMINFSLNFDEIQRAFSRTQRGGSQEKYAIQKMYPIYMTTPENELPQVI